MGYCMWAVFGGPGIVRWGVSPHTRRSHRVEQPPLDCSCFLRRLALVPCMRGEHGTTALQLLWQVCRSIVAQCTYAQVHAAASSGG
jgi:hypothetical protein